MVVNRAATLTKKKINFIVFSFWMATGLQLHLSFLRYAMEGPFATGGFPLLWIREVLLLCFAAGLDHLIVLVSVDWFS